jgi:hypothetical protein
MCRPPQEFPASGFKFHVEDMELEIEPESPHFMSRVEFLQLET